MRKILLTALAGSVAMATAQMASAAFVEDSKTTVEAKGAYISSDNRSGSYDSREAAGGVLGHFESGFTDGSAMGGFGFGLDAMVGVGFKLDGSVKKDGLGNNLPQTGLLPDNQNGYTKVGLTGKVKYSESVLRVGTLTPNLPVLMHNNDRLLPQMFSGVQLDVNEFENLSLTGGQIWQVNHRNSQDYERLSFERRGGAVDELVTGSKFSYIGGTYQIRDDLSATYLYADLDGEFKQHFAGLNHGVSFYEGQLLNTEVRYFQTTGKKFSLADPSLGDKHLNNKALSLGMDYSVSGHALGLSYQKMSGSAGFVKLSGTDSYLHNDSIVSDFGNKNEKSWKISYGYDFADLGMEGLEFNTSYVKGTDVDDFSNRKGKEWERNTQVSYKFQDGSAKDLSLALKNATHRSNFAGGTDELHLVVSYPLSM